MHTDLEDSSLKEGDFTAYARDHLLREVIAFANAQGGTVIIGMDQTAEWPATKAFVPV
jgi:predicted HTH transcriptional regulator